MALIVKCFTRGVLVRVTAAFTNVDGDPADPDAVTVRVMDPALDEVDKVYGVDVSVVKDDVGEYHYDVNANQAGDWVYRWEGTGQAQAAAEAKFKVASSAFPMGSP